MRSLLILSLVLMTAISVRAAEKRMTLYLDGARVETEISAVNGYAEMPLPGSMTANSMRIKPVRGVLSSVDVVPGRPERRHGNELAQLVDKKEKLTDRLQALDVREEIFRAAAKSQSGKAPRKTKTNREPLEEIRKGTEFAIAQLEGVYNARRRTKTELQLLENRLVTLRKSGNHGGSIAKIRFAGKEGRAVVSWLQPSPKWTPVYDFRLTDDTDGEAVLYALLPKVESGTTLAVVPSAMADAAGKAAVYATSPGRIMIFSTRISTDSQKYSSVPQPEISFSFRNISGKPLPPGEATCYRQGEFLGTATFNGALQDEVQPLSFGAIASGAAQ